MIKSKTGCVREESLKVCTSFASLQDLHMGSYKVKGTNECENYFAHFHARLPGGNNSIDGAIRLFAIHNLRWNLKRFSVTKDINHRCRDYLYFDYLKICDLDFAWGT